MEYNWITLIDKNGVLYNVMQKDRELYNDREATIEEIEHANKINDLNSEFDSLKTWFNTDYTKLEQKYRRLDALNVLTDNGLNPLICLTELYEEAERKRKRIQELEILIS